MKKDAYYFPHFCTARHDRKIMRLRKELGVEGYAIYFMLLEVLREQEGFRYPLEDADLLADEFGVSEQKVNIVICKYDLFEIDTERMFFSPRLEMFLEPYLKMKEQRREAGLRSGEVRKKNKQSLNGCSTVVERLLNENEQSKVKKSKVKKSKVKEIVVVPEKTTTAKNPYSVFQENIGMMNPHIAERMVHIVKDGVTEELLCKYIEIALERGKSNWGYIEKMALGNLKDNVRTVEEYEAYCVEFRNKRGKEGQKTQQYQNFEQREYNDEDFDKYFDNVEG